MPYSAEVSRVNPSCFIFLIDQSGSMNELINATDIRPLDNPYTADGKTYTHTGTGRTKAQALSDAVNRLLRDLTIKCAKSEGVRDYYYVSVIGYGATVGPALAGPLAGRDIVSISEIADNPARVEQRTRKVEDGAGGLVDQAIRFPVWFDPVSNGGTPMCSAFQEAQRILNRWLTDHPHCFPPAVIHITDGESTDGDPSSLMAEVMGQQSTDGNVLLFNLHLSSDTNAQQVTFPDDISGLPDQYARLLFSGSSFLTRYMQSIAGEHGLRVTDGSRAFVLNAELPVIIQALDIGTRPSNLR